MQSGGFEQRRDAIAPELDQLTQEIIGACIEVHRELGPGLMEIMYKNAVSREFNLRGITFQKEVIMPVFYKGVRIGEGRLDLLVAGKVIVELKTCESLTSVHRAQLICYLRLMKLDVGLLINFNVGVLADGIKRVVIPR